MGLKNKVFQVILRVICAIFLVVSIFLGVIAVICSFGGGTPNIFGSNVYLVETDAFGFLNKGTALFASQVHPSEIQPKNIVVFMLENKKPAIGQVLQSELYDGVYSFNVITDNNIEITLTQSQVIAKGMSFSDLWGAVISFAVSPLGMLLIAVVPCLVIILLEFTKFITKVMPQPEIETVKKQYEVPTYTPETELPASGGKGKAISAYRRSAALDDSIGLYDAQVKRSTSVERTDVLEVSGTQQPPLFSAPKKPPRKPQNAAMPLSQKKLNEAIAAKKAEDELLEMQRQREQAVNEIKRTRGAAIASEKAMELESDKPRLTSTAAVRNKLSGTREIMDQNAIAKAAEKINKTAALPQEEFKPEFTPQQRNTQTHTLRLQQDEIKQYTPKENTHATSSIPRLDALLSDDGESGNGYSIDDILAGLDKRG